MTHATRLAGHERSASHRPGVGLAGRDVAAVRRPRTRRRLVAQPVAADAGGPDARRRRRRVRRDSAHRRLEHPAAARFRRRRDLLLFGPDRRGLRLGRPASGPRDEGDSRRAARDVAAARGIATRRRGGAGRGRALVAAGDRGSPPRPLGSHLPRRGRLALRPAAIARPALPPFGPGELQPHPDPDVARLSAPLRVLCRVAAVRARLSPKDSRPGARRNPGRRRDLGPAVPGVRRRQSVRRSPLGPRVARPAPPAWESAGSRRRTSRLPTTRTWCEPSARPAATSF